LFLCPDAFSPAAFLAAGAWLPSGRGAPGAVGFWDGSKASRRPPRACFRATAVFNTESALCGAAVTAAIWCSMRSNRSIKWESCAAESRCMCSALPASSAIALCAEHRLPWRRMKLIVVHCLDVGFENADVLGHFAPCGASRQAPHSLAARQSARAPASLHKTATGHRKNTTPPPIRNQTGRPPGRRADQAKKAFEERRQPSHGACFGLLDRYTAEHGVSPPRSYVQSIRIRRGSSGGAGRRNGFVRRIIHTGAPRMVKAL
jgi:hypothetical protein